MKKSPLLVVLFLLIFFYMNAQETNFKEIDIQNLPDNVVKLIGDDWMLVTAGSIDSCNMMTASWGGIGNLWNMPVAFIFIRPQRYTYQFTEKEEYFTLTFFEEKDRYILNFCGSNSGKNVDKIKETRLIPLQTDLGNVYYKQARVVIECQKVYSDFIDNKGFTNPELSESVYPQKDYHKMYVGKIIKVMIREN
ncbi:MAG TPA: flavin reductase [Bacteroidales bacterium]|nr:flavin reductase [Bacteroidales bacterium]